MCPQVTSGRQSTREAADRACTPCLVPAGTARGLGEAGQPCSPLLTLRLCLLQLFNVPGPQDTGCHHPFRGGKKGGLAG